MPRWHLPHKDICLKNYIRALYRVEGKLHNPLPSTRYNVIAFTPTQRAGVATCFLPVMSSRGRSVSDFGVTGVLRVREYHVRSQNHEFGRT